MMARSSGESEWVHVPALTWLALPDPLQQVLRRIAMSCLEGEYTIVLRFSAPLAEAVVARIRECQGDECYRRLVEEESRWSLRAAPQRAEPQRVGGGEMPTFRVSRWVAAQLVATGGKEHYKVQFLRLRVAGEVDSTTTQRGCRVTHQPSGVAGHAWNRGSDALNLEAARDECYRRVLAHYLAVERARKRPLKQGESE
ncbi:MAG: hypothetical protein FJX77_03050 [Armatimonadetes bacterium]|nr:hypothetical protein [Armatimonadota bacterium]